MIDEPAAGASLLIAARDKSAELRFRTSLAIKSTRVAAQPRVKAKRCVLPRPAMSALDWFPGHMVTAKKEAALTMRATDVVIEVLDARAPLASRNPMIESLRLELQRPALKVLNKADVADPAQTKAWLHFYEQQPHTTAIAISAKNSGEAQRIIKASQALAPTRKGLTKPLRLMILGIPNVGKSTLMNSLLKRHVAKVGDEPAITKQQMRHEVARGIYIVDTPGMTWPGISLSVGTLLAITNSIGRNAYDEENIARALADLMLKKYPGLLHKRFPANPADPQMDSAEALLTRIAKARGYLRPGGAFDLEKAAGVLLKEFRQGTLGRVTLQSPPAQPEAGPPPTPEEPQTPPT